MKSRFILFSIFTFVNILNINAQIEIPVPPGIQELFCINFHNQYGVSGGLRLNLNDATISPPPTEGKIIHSSNGFNWELSTIPPGITSIENIQLADDLVGYATGSRHDTAVFLKTTDGGASWNNYGDLSYYKSFNSQYFGDNSVGFLTVDNNGHGEILKTTSGGASWNKILSLNDSSKINKIIFGNSNIGFAFGNIKDTCILLKTTDSGINWFRNISSTIQKIQDITFSDSLTYYFVSQDTHSSAYKTTDAGTTWIKMILTDSYPMFKKVDFLPGGNIGFIFWDMLIVGYYKTTDNGNTWSDPYGFELDYSIFGSCMAPGDKYYLTTSNIYNAQILLVNGYVPVELSSFESKLSLSDVLLKWTTVTEKNNKGFIVQRKFNDGDWKELGFITGNGTKTELHSYNFSDKLSESGKYSYRLKQVDFGGASEFSKVEVVNFNSPDKYSLSQNYPNPFNPSTKIKYSIPTAGKTSLIVYDIMGCEKACLVNEYLSAGEYEVELDTRNFNLTSGVYFCRMAVEHYLSVIKIVLLK